MGVVPIDLNNPDAPVIHPAVALPGATQHVTVADGHLYAAIGGAGPFDGIFVTGIVAVLLT